MGKFTIFREGNRWVSIPTSQSWGKRLVGLHIFARGKETVVEPIYLPVIQIDRSAGLTSITLSWDMPLLTVLLSNRYPFIVFLKAVKNEDVEGDTC
jgi:hypothetical protein